MPLLINNDIVATCRKENLEILRSRHFNNSTLLFSTNEGSLEAVNSDLTQELDEFLTLNLLRKAIKELPLGKAPGPDNIRNEMIKRLPTLYLKELLTQFRFSIASGFIPPVWLEVKTIFIEKNCDKPRTDPKAYRPIGLSSTILKLIERIVNWRLKTTVLLNGIPRQHGFTIGKSTETALSEVVHVLEKAKYLGQKALVLSVDIQGAFDTVPFNVMKDSLIEHKAEQKLVVWLDYLARNRSVYISQGDDKCNFRPQEGTTQGGHNGPDLWNISIWDLIKLKLLKRAFVCKYADDVFIILVGIDINVLRDLLQQCLNEINQWFRSKGLVIAPTKSFCMAFNLKRSPPPKPLSLNGHEIPNVTDFKYLGVIIDSNLTWKKHVMYRVKKAKRDLMAAKRLITKSWGLNPGRMKWIYEGIVRPSLDYACHVWHKPNISLTLKNELDRVQRLAMACITSCFRSTPTAALERLLNILPLDLHLSNKACTTVHRIYNAVDKSNWDGIGSGQGRSHLFVWKNYVKSL